MKELFNIKNIELDKLKMDNYKYIRNVEYQNYYKDLSSKEHYRLLTHISNYFSNEIFIDIGTFKGCSALALATNKCNEVYSFNIVKETDLNKLPENCIFILDDILKENYKDLILKSKLILLDTNHDGVFEISFYEHLKKMNYKGYLLLDDIFLNSEMMSFWKNIELDKLNITQLGHSTGTGVVFFN